LKNDIGPRLVEMVRKIEVALTGSIARGPQNKENIKKMRSPGGKVARIAEGIR
ncbi:MAG: IclR family transcriptional regulator, partial [Bradyrhizobium sp.]